MSVATVARRVLQGLVLVALLSIPVPAAAADTVAVVIELRALNGEVRIKAKDDTLWRAVQPLLALRAGDQVTATGDSRVVLVLTQGRGTRTVTAANSPFTVDAAARSGPAGQPRETLGRVVAFLLGYQKDLRTVPVAVRPILPIRVAILSPRDTQVLPGSVTFEWTGWQSLRYRIRVFGPEGVMWEAVDLPRASLSYPDSAPPLRAGVRYVWQLAAPNLPVEQARFEVLSPAEAERVRTTLTLLAGDPSGSGSLSSVAVLRAGFLLQEGLAADARHELLAAVSADPDEPTIHLLLGHVYEKIGVAELAQREFIEARQLSGRLQ